MLILVVGCGWLSAVGRSHGAEARALRPGVVVRGRGCGEREVPRPGSGRREGSGRRLVVGTTMGMLLQCSVEGVTKLGRVRTGDPDFRGTVPGGKSGQRFRQVMDEAVGRFEAGFEMK